MKHKLFTTLGVQFLPPTSRENFPNSQARQPSVNLTHRILHNSSSLRSVSRESSPNPPSTPFKPVPILSKALDASPNFLDPSKAVAKSSPSPGQYFNAGGQIHLFTRQSENISESEKRRSVFMQVSELVKGDPSLLGTVPCQKRLVCCRALLFWWMFHGVEELQCDCRLLRPLWCWEHWWRRFLWLCRHSVFRWHDMVCPRIAPTFCESIHLRRRTNIISLGDGSTNNRDAHLHQCLMSCRLPNVPCLTRWLCVHSKCYPPLQVLQLKRVLNRSIFTV